MVTSYSNWFLHFIKYEKTYLDLILTLGTFDQLKITVDECETEEDY